MQKHREIFRYDPDVGYTFVPNLKARIPHEAGGYLLATNPQGFRSSHDFAAVPSGRKRILVFGDSFTAGDGVSNKQRYTDLIESDLPDVEVFNFGMSGTGSDQQYLIHRKFAANIPADLVVVAVLVENIRRNVAQYRKYVDPEGREFWKAKPYFSLENNTLVRGNDPVPDEPVPVGEAAGLMGEKALDRGGRFPVLRRLVRKAGLGALAQKISRYQPVPDFNSPDTDAWKLMRAILRQWISEIRAPVVLMPIPLYHHVEGLASARAYQARFRELADESGAALHDPLPDLLAYSAEDRRAFRFENDVHLSPAGHRALATSLAKALTFK